MTDDLKKDTLMMIRPPVLESFVYDLIVINGGVKDDQGYAELKTIMIRCVTRDVQGDVAPMDVDEQDNGEEAEVTSSCKGADKGRLGQGRGLSEEWPTGSTGQAHYAKRA